ncbi:MAG: hypothetical protein V1921_04855 [Candidatus Altiarchaeota archaeon]
MMLKKIGLILLVIGVVLTSGCITEETQQSTTISHISTTSIVVTTTSTLSSINYSIRDYIDIVLQQQDEIENDLGILIQVSEDKSKYWDGSWYVNILSPPEEGPMCISCCDQGYAVLTPEGEIEKIFLEYRDCNNIECDAYNCERLPRFKEPWDI